MTEKRKKPLVKAPAVKTQSKPHRIGFATGEFAVPDDFDRMFEAEIEALFFGSTDSATGS
jgi:hypothetical protein